MGEDFFGLGNAAPIILMVILFYVLLYRPQKKQQERQQDMVSKLKRGTKVVTRGGIFGRVDLVKETTVMLEVAEGVVIEVAKPMIATAFVTEEELKESSEPVQSTTEEAKDKE
ncbi:Preprotein translocase subunit YajC [Anaerovibrio sp. JC8]|uniref:preprotein translocase subunit YajC n=1 Tax=Anaerovibrio sp. JC8 TaxID=1240085 RepID=UPI000A0B1E06|nr:preprotein translocase subunit YajC [Anaerovibrio sp. JC8]ORU00158.1 Preprotein translocase subunit YajC [Anaerovibrio sp. JC8]